MRCCVLFIVSLISVVVHAADLLPLWGDRFWQDSLPATMRESYITFGEQYAGKAWKTLPATVFSEYKKIGNRVHYEQLMFEKRRQLAALVVAELAEGQRRFLPDIIFMLIFFFMVSTTMRESTLLVKKPQLPKATEFVKLEKKSLVSSIYIAQPTLQWQKIFGTQPVLQLNEAIADKSKIAEFVELERNSMPANDRSQMTVSLKIDSKVKMGIVTDVKMELRKANALKISYSVIPK